VSMPDPVEVERVLACAQCGRPHQFGAVGWRASWTDDEPPAVVVFCPECARARVRRVGKKGVAQSLVLLSNTAWTQRLSVRSPATGCLGERAIATAGKAGTRGTPAGFGKGRAAPPGDRGTSQGRSSAPGPSSTFRRRTQPRLPNGSRSVTASTRRIATYSARTQSVGGVHLGRPKPKRATPSSAAHAHARDARISQAGGAGASGDWRRRPLIWGGRLRRGGLVCADHRVGCGPFPRL